MTDEGSPADCICPKCREPLFLKKIGNHNDAVLSHEEYTDCDGVDEERLFSLFKEILLKNHNIIIPSILPRNKPFILDYKAEDVNEKSVVLKEEGYKDIYVEFYREFLDEERVQKYLAYRSHVISLNIDNLLETKYYITRNDIVFEILDKTTSKEWLYHTELERYQRTKDKKEKQKKNTKQEKKWDEFLYRIYIESHKIKSEEYSKNKMFLWVNHKCIFCGSEYESSRLPKQEIEFPYKMQHKHYCPVKNINIEKFPYDSRYDFILELDKVLKKDKKESFYKNAISYLEGVKESKDKNAWKNECFSQYYQPVYEQFQIEFLE